MFDLNFVVWHGYSKLTHENPYHASCKKTGRFSSSRLLGLKVPIMNHGGPGSNSNLATWQTPRNLKTRLFTRGMTGCK
jgi:hypothetical protein